MREREDQRDFFGFDSQQDLRFSHAMGGMSSWSGSSEDEVARKRRVA